MIEKNLNLKSENIPKIFTKRSYPNLDTVCNDKYWFLNQSSCMTHGYADLQFMLETNDINPSLIKNQQRLI